MASNSVAAAAAATLLLRPKCVHLATVALSSQRASASNPRRAGTRTGYEVQFAPRERPNGMLDVTNHETGTGTGTFTGV